MARGKVCQFGTRTIRTKFLVIGLCLLLAMSSAFAVDTGGDNGTTSPNDVTPPTTTSSTSSTTTTTTSTSRESAGQVASGYAAVAQTLDFAKTANSSQATLGMSNGHQNGMLLMAMLLDNKSYIESGDPRPAISLFDFNPEDIQDLDENDFYAAANGTEDNDIGDSKTAVSMVPSTPSTTTTTTTEEAEENLWNLSENAMPLVMKTNGQMLPGSASVSESSRNQDHQNGGENGSEGNIYKVKLRRRPETKRMRDRHRSISSQMAIVGNEVTTIKQFQTLTTMFDHWQWRPEVFEEHVSRQCGQDMKTYLDSLQLGELWALKGEEFISSQIVGGK